MFRKLWRRLRRLFKRPVDRDAPLPTDWTPAPELPKDEGNVITIEKEDAIKGILIFVGHTPEKYGTRTYNKIKEQVSNALTAEILEDKWAESLLGTRVPLEVRYRKYSSYSSHCSDSRREVKKYAEKLGVLPKNILSIELHYNAAGVPNARGGYFMVEKGDKRSAKVAKDLIDFFVRSTSMSYRKEYLGMLGIEGRDSGRGFGWIDYVNDNGGLSLLFEPFFCDYETRETGWLFGKSVLNSEERAKQMSYVAERMSNLWVKALTEAVNKFNE